MRIPAGSFILATNPLRKPATYRLSRRAMISSISSQLRHVHGGPCLCREFGILPSQRDVHHHVQPSWITVFSWSGRMSPPIEATRALLVLINAQLNLADASVWVVAGHPARVFGYLAGPHETETEAELLKPNMCCQPSRSSRCGRILCWYCAK